MEIPCARGGLVYALDRRADRSRRPDRPVSPGDELLSRSLLPQAQRASFARAILRLDPARLGNAFGAQPSIKTEARRVNLGRRHGYNPFLADHARRFRFDRDDGDFKCRRRRANPDDSR